MHHVVEARIGVFHQFAEARPFLAELRRVVRGGELARYALNAWPRRKFRWSRRIATR